jgi:hypothetical protein
VVTIAHRSGELKSDEALLASVAMTEKVKVQAKDLQQLSTLVDENNKLQQSYNVVSSISRHEWGSNSQF